jgi:hypothetical protein
MEGVVETLSSAHMLDMVEEEGVQRFMTVPPEDVAEGPATAITREVPQHNQDPRVVDQDSQVATTVQDSVRAAGVLAVWVSQTADSTAQATLMVWLVDLDTEELPHLCFSMVWVMAVVEGVEPVETAVVT